MSIAEYLINYTSTIITFIFLLIILSYYLLAFIKHKKPMQHKHFSSITVIIPAHNEGQYIKEAIESVIAADFNGLKQIIVVDDGSKDRTSEIASGYKHKGVLLVKTKHSGKSASINKAVSLAKGELIAIVDADSTIHKNALQEMALEVGRENVAAATGIIKVKNRKKFICMWFHIEQMYNSLMRLLFSKISANITTPGPLSIYRKKELIEINGFSTKGFSEDQDIAIRLIRKGYKIGFAENAVAETNMPSDAKGVFLQRTRFARGIINILKKHMKLNKTIIDVYTFPLFLFAYIQAVIMGSLTIYNIISGYSLYFASKGIYFSFEVLRFFFEWFSIIGFIKWTISAIIGSTPLTFVAMLGIASTLLSYPLFLFAIFKFDKKFDIFHLIPIFFMFPFWLFIMAIYIICIPEMFVKKQYNIWKKNE